MPFVEYICVYVELVVVKWSNEWQNKSVVDSDACSCPIASLPTAEADNISTRSRKATMT
jgi:hypothetical protein